MQKHHVSGCRSGRGGRDDDDDDDGGGGSVDDDDDDDDNDDDDYNDGYDGMTMTMMMG